MKHFNELIVSAVLTGLVWSADSSAAFAQADAAISLTGTWTMSLVGDHVIPLGLSLEQNGAALTGTLTMMGKEIPVKGELRNGAFTLTGAASMMRRGHGAGGEATPQSSPMPMKFTGSVKEDGTLFGELGGPEGPMKWTADRLKERANAAPGGSRTPEAFMGSWNAVVSADHAISVGLLIQNEGGRTKAVATLMGAEVPMTGEFSSGLLTLTGAFPEAGAAGAGLRGAVKMTVRVKDDATLAGDFTLSHGSFPLTASRLKGH